MLRKCFLLSAILGWGLGMISPSAGADAFRRLTMDAYRDKMAGGWIGQMVGVGWGGPTEFRWQGEIIPADQIPVWKPEMVNQFQQDDIYVEMTFLRSLEQYGFDVPIRQAGIDFANSGYPLWHANKAGRDNLRAGIAPPDSSHPKFNAHADDIDYQIEADFAGLIAPGLPNTVIELGEKFGRLMNYGDGVYGGQFVGGMYAAAFFEEDPVRIVEAGLACIPAESQYAESIRDTLRWFAENPDDWQKTWNLVNAKYHLNPAYRRFSCSGPNGKFNIDAKVNGVYIVMGLLYGRRNPEQTVVISTRCGQDSDCNPSNAGGVLFTTMGMHSLPEPYVSKLDRKPVFSHTPYNFDSLVAVCEKLARQAVVRAGGRVEKDASGAEVLVIPVEKPQPSAAVSCWEPGPIAESRFSEEEMARISALSEQKRLEKDLQTVAPGWQLRQCGPDMEPGLREEFRGRKNVFLSHPLDRDTPCVLARTIDVPAGKTTALRIAVTHDPRGDFTLRVRVDGQTVLEKEIGPASVADGWADLSVDLTPHAGKSVDVELLNCCNGWQFEAAYWAGVEVVSE